MTMLEERTPEFDVEPLDDTAHVDTTDVVVEGEIAYVPTADVQEPNDEADDLQSRRAMHGRVILRMAKELADMGYARTVRRSIFKEYGTQIDDSLVLGMDDRQLRAYVGSVAAEAAAADRAESVVTNSGGIVH